MLYGDQSRLIVLPSRPRAKHALQTLGGYLLDDGMGRQGKTVTDEKGKNPNHQEHLPMTKIARVTGPLKQSG